MTVHNARADGRLARRSFSTGLMSDTKWRKLLGVLEAGCDPMPTYVTVKFVGVIEPKRMAFPFGLSPPRPYVDTIEFGPTALRDIEWLDIPGDVTDLLKPRGQFPAEFNGAHTRITGYAGRIDDPSTPEV